jgi:putative hemolysin
MQKQNAMDPQVAPFRSAFRKAMPNTVPQPLFEAILKILQVAKTDDLYHRLQGGDAESFCERLLAALRVEVVVPAADLASVPRTGPVLAVANHPFGIVEGVALARLLPTIRPDVKILANSVLAALPELNGRMIPVETFGGPEASRVNSRGIREALTWLKNGGMLLVFPAGEVSQLRLELGKPVEVVDPVWSRSIAWLLKRTKATALPIYIAGRNSALFQLAGLVHPRLRSALLPLELLNKQQTRVELRCGTPILAARVAQFADEEALVEHLRWRTYLLRRREWVGRRQLMTGKPLSEPIPVDCLRMEMSEQPLLRAGEMDLYVRRGVDLPFTLREIGRLREETFRRVGEGTGKTADLDRYDAYYHHLYLWHRGDERIVGAYRLGLVDEIVARRGVKGLYTHSLFAFDERLLRYMGPAIELGRSFVHPDYQRGFQPLLMLWKGIGRFVLDHAPARVLFGPVSISADYAQVSRELMASVLSRQNGNPLLERLVKARRPLKPSHDVQQPTYCDLHELAELVANLEPDGKSIPVLLRQYLKLGGQLLAFHVDPKFGNCLDGLIVVDLAATDAKLLERYMGAAGAREFLDQNRERRLRARGAVDTAVKRVALDGFPSGLTN